MCLSPMSCVANGVYAASEEGHRISSRNGFVVRDDTSTNPPDVPPAGAAGPKKSSEKSKGRLPVGSISGRK